MTYGGSGGVPISPMNTGLALLLDTSVLGHKWQYNAGITVTSNASCTVTLLLPGSRATKLPHPQRCCRDDEIAILIRPTSSSKLL